MLLSPYPVHLGLDQGRNIHDSGLTSPHQGKDVPIRLQGACAAKTLLPGMQDPIKEVVEDLDRDCLQCRHWLLANILAVPDDVRVRIGAVSQARSET